MDVDIGGMILKQLNNKIGYIIILEIPKKKKYFKQSFQRELTDTDLNIIIRTILNQNINKEN